MKLFTWVSELPVRQRNSIDQREGSGPLPQQEYSRSSRFWHVVNSKRCPKCGAKKQELCRDMRMTFPHDLEGSRLHRERKVGTRAI